MALVLTAFIMIAGLTAAAIIKLESERKNEQFARLSGRRNARFIGR